MDLKLSWEQYSSDWTIGRDKANSIIASESSDFKASVCHFAASFQLMVSVWSVYQTALTASTIYHKRIESGIILFFVTVI